MIPMVLPCLSEGGSELVADIFLSKFACGRIKGLLELPECEWLQSHLVACVIVGSCPEEDSEWAHSHSDTIGQREVGQE